MRTAIKSLIVICLAALLTAPATAGTVETMPREWHYSQQSNNPKRDAIWSNVTRLVGKPAKELRPGQWYGKKTSVQANRGKGCRPRFLGHLVPAVYPLDPAQQRTRRKV